MICNHCGKEISSDAKFCPKCGNKIQPRQKSASKKAIRPKKTSATLLSVVAIIAAAVAVAAVIFAVIMIKNSRTSEVVQGDDKYGNSQAVENLIEKAEQKQEVKEDTAEQKQEVKENTAEQETQEETEVESRNIDFSKCEKLESFLDQIVTFTNNEDDLECSLTLQNLKDIFGWTGGIEDYLFSEVALKIDTETEKRFLNSLGDEYIYIKQYPSGFFWMDKNGYLKYVESAIGDDRFSNDESYDEFVDIQGEYSSFRFEDYCVIYGPDAGYMGPGLGNFISAENIGTDKWRLEYELVDSEEGNFFGYERTYYDATRSEEPLIGKAYFIVIRNDESIFDGLSVQSIKYDFVEPKRDAVVMDAFKRFLNDEARVYIRKPTQYEIEKYGPSEENWSDSLFSEYFEWIIEDFGKPAAYLYDVDNDHEMELLIDTISYGFTIIDCRGDEIYLLDEGDGTASVCSIYRDKASGTAFVGHSDFSHMGRQYLDITEYDGSGNIVNSTMSLNADYWENEDDFGTDRAEYSFNGYAITYEKYANLREIYALVDPEMMIKMDY